MVEIISPFLKFVRKKYLKNVEKLRETDKEIHLLWVVCWSDGFGRKPIIMAKSVGEFSTAHIYSIHTYIFTSF